MPAGDDDPVEAVHAAGHIGIANAVICLFGVKGRCPQKVFAVGV